MALIIRGRSLFKGSTIIGKRPYAIEGVYNPALVFDFKNDYYRTDSAATTFSTAITHARASSATMVNSSGVLVTVGNNVARENHHLYDGVAWVNEGLLQESEARTNKLINSSDFTAWATDSATLANTGATAPDGSTSWRITDDGTASYHGAYLANAFTVGAGFTTWSVMCREGTARYVAFAPRNAPVVSTVNVSVIFDLQTGVFTDTGNGPNTSYVDGYGSENLGGGWWRIYLKSDLNSASYDDIGVFISTDGLYANLSYTGTGTYIDFALAQIEVGSTPSSYIPTSGATATRAAETLTVPAAKLPWPTPVYGTELVTNGTFDSNLTGWTLSASLTPTWVAGGYMQFNSDGSGYSVAQQSFTTVVGKPYVFSFAMVANAQALTVTVSTTQGGSNISSVVYSTLATHQITFVATSTTTWLGFSDGSGVTHQQIDNISVKQVTYLPLSIQMNGEITYAQNTSSTNMKLFDWSLDSDNRIESWLNNSSSNNALYTFQEAGNILDTTSISDAFSPGINVPFNIASRHGSTFINSASDGAAGTANTTPTALPDLSATDFLLGNKYMGTIAKFIMWGDDIGDTGIAEATTVNYGNDFAMTVATTTTAETFTIPAQDVGTFAAGIDWGDGSISSITAYNDADLTHTYADAGDHTIRISGSFPNVYFNNGGDKLKVKSVENLGVVGWTRLNRSFFGCANMTSFTAGSTDTSAVTDMSVMIRNCTGLTSVDVSSFNTAAVTSMAYTFQNCRSLTSLDLSSFNTAAVLSMDSMFDLCGGLTSLNVSSFDTSAVTIMSDMFYECDSLTSLDLSNFNNAAVTDMDYMFYNCTGLTSLNLTGFTTPSVTNVYAMFYSCTGLTSLDVTSFNTAAVTNMGLMFRNCRSLTSLDFSNFNTAAVTNMTNMFRQCFALTPLDVSSFAQCNSLTSIVGVEDFDISGLNSTGDLTGFITVGRMTTAEYDATLINWDALTVFAGMSPAFGVSTYTGGGTAATARANLISSDGWIISDGGIA